MVSSLQVVVNRLVPPMAIVGTYGNLVCLVLVAKWSPLLMSLKALTDRLLAINRKLVVMKCLCVVLQMSLPRLVMTIPTLRLSVAVTIYLTCLLSLSGLRKSILVRLATLG